MRAAHRELIPVSGEILLGEVGRACRVKSKELLHIEDLNTVVDSLGADDSIVTKDSDFSPVGSFRVVLWKTTQVHQLALGADLSEGSAVVLANGDKLAAVF